MSNFKEKTKKVVATYKGAKIASEKRSKIEILIKKAIQLSKTDSEKASQLIDKISTVVDKEIKEASDALKKAESEAEKKSINSQKEKLTKTKAKTKVAKTKTAKAPKVKPTTKTAKAKSKKKVNSFEEELDRLRKLRPYKGRLSTAPIDKNHDRDLLKDGKIQAKEAGKRITKEGKVYYEYRDNRTDARPKAPKPYKLKKGGTTSYAEGGVTEVEEDGSNIPEALMDVLSQMDLDKEGDYIEMERLRGLAQEEGYGFDYGLDGVITEFWEVTLPRMAKGGEIESGVLIGDIDLSKHYPIQKSSMPTGNNETIYVAKSKNYRDSFRGDLMDRYGVKSEIHKMLGNPLYVSVKNDQLVEGNENSSAYAKGGSVDVEDAYHKKVRDWMYDNLPYEHHCTSLDEIPLSVFTKSQLKKREELLDEFYQLQKDWHNESEYYCDNETCRKEYSGEYNGGFCSDECKGEYSKGGQIIPNVGAVSHDMLKGLLMKNKSVLAVLGKPEIDFMKRSDVDVISVDGKNYDFIFTDGKQEFEIINQDRKLKHPLRKARAKVAAFYKGGSYAKGGSVEKTVWKNKSKTWAITKVGKKFYADNGEYSWHTSYEEGVLDVENPRGVKLLLPKSVKNKLESFYKKQKK